MILERFSLAGKVAVVTGAGRGLGRGIARGLAEAGADLVLLSRTRAELDEAAEEVRALGRRALPIATDVRDAGAVAAAAAQVVQELGRVDVLMNNAGGGYPGSFLDLSEAQFDEVVRWNLRPVFLCCRAFGRLLRAQRSGSIINMSSLAGRVPTPGLAVYAATKAAVTSLTASLAHELAPFSVRVNAVAPGKMLASHTSTGALWATEAARAAAAGDVALGRLGSAEDVAALVVFLASDAASYLTGQSISLDGGWGALSLVPAELGGAGAGAAGGAAGGEGDGAAPAATALLRRVQLHLNGVGARSFFIEAGDGPPRLQGGTAERPDATLTMAAEDWHAVRAGRLDRVQAFMEGKMQIQGDLTLLAQLEGDIDRLANAMLAAEAAGE